MLKEGHYFQIEADIIASMRAKHIRAQNTQRLLDLCQEDCAIDEDLGQESGVLAVQAML
jgi:hypothetical protein